MQRLTPLNTSNVISYNVFIHHLCVRSDSKLLILNFTHYRELLPIQNILINKTILKE